MSQNDLLLRQDFCGQPVAFKAISSPSAVHPHPVKAGMDGEMKMDFKIEKNVPMPVGRSMYPFAEMEVGDSFAIPEGSRVAVAAAAHKFGRDHKKKFAFRKTPDGVRCWRKE